MNVTFTFEKLLDAFVNPRYRGVASKGGTRSGKTWAVLQMLHKQHGLLDGVEVPSVRYLQALAGGYGVANSLADQRKQRSGICALHDAGGHVEHGKAPG